MKLKIYRTDSPGRIANLLIDDKKINTPNILHLDTSHFSIPDFSDILLSNKKNGKEGVKPLISTFNIKNSYDLNLDDSYYLQFLNCKELSKKSYEKIIHKIKKNSDYFIVPGNLDIVKSDIIKSDALIYIIANAYQLFKRGNKFVEFITNLRDKIGYEKIIYIPSIADPSNLSLLTYLGADLFDSASAIIATLNRVLLFPTGNMHIDYLHELPCSCKECVKFQDDPSKIPNESILYHNYSALNDELRLVRNSILNGNLRELVESRVRTDQLLTTDLKNIDLQYNFLEKRTAVVSDKKLLATTIDSLNRAEIKRFQERLINRYRKPVSARVLLLLPCSAKKPYSFSKTHKLIINRINGIKNSCIVHEVIVTSPIGLVPRELELVYPASNYDIPVVGIWNEDEKKMIRDLIKKYVSLNSYDNLIIHLPLALQEFVNDLFVNPIITCTDKPTGDDSLDKLANKLEEITKSYEYVKKSHRIKENVLSLASYQFGRDIAEKLLENCEIKGKYPFQKIMNNGIQIGMITKSRGFISLTMKGAEILADSSKYFVEIADDFILRGSVFAPGIINADESIRKGDEVVVVKNKKACAVGVALMNGEEMKVLSFGEAVKVRHLI